ncbi:MAG: tyrosine--tRNA ligase [Dehalococcoidales bacterium]|nr:tyrosine--tRNA ligase [Dehalococcoidales bacterium]
MDINQDTGYLLKRGVAEIIVGEEMMKLLRSGKKLRLKEGFDPSFPDIHLGHMVALRKLRQFQELGHQVVLIVGDWTARIGDPSGASVTRPMLSAEQVQANAQTYMEQFFKIVDKEKTEVRWQSEWYGRFDLSDVIRLTSKFTVAQLLARDDFSKRFSAGKPIAITELLYPLLQAYDSVAIEADVEFGGTDQKFNLLVGRELQSMLGQPPQQIFMVPLLVGTDGTQKMSKSLGNYIGVAEPADEIYGKVMSISRDGLIMDYFELLTDVPDEELKQFRLSLEAALKTVRVSPGGVTSLNPMELKKRLAREIVAQLYDQKAATEAEERFEKVHQSRELPDNIQEYRISFNKLTSEQAGRAFIDVSRLLVETRLAESRSEANRLISQAGTTLAGEVVTSRLVPASTVQSGTVIQVGKRRFAKVINTDVETAK